MAWHRVCGRNTHNQGGLGLKYVGYWSDYPARSAAKWDQIARTRVTPLFIWTERSHAINTGCFGIT